MPRKSNVVIYFLALFICRQLYTSRLSTKCTGSNSWINIRCVLSIGSLRFQSYAIQNTEWFGVMLVDVSDSVANYILFSPLYKRMGIQYGCAWCTRTAGYSAGRANYLMIYTLSRIVSTWLYCVFIVVCCNIQPHPQGLFHRHYGNHVSPSTNKITLNDMCKSLNP